MLIDGEQIRISCCHPQSLGAGVTVYSWSLYCLQFSPKITKYIKQGLGLGFEVSFFFPSHILGQTLTTVMYLFFFLPYFQMESHNNSLEKKYWK